MVSVHGLDFELMISADEIRLAIDGIAARISADLMDKDPLCVVVLNGAFVFAADLVRALDFDPQMSFVKVSSYKHMQSTGTIEESIGLTDNLEGRHVLVIEDIVDTGHTVAYLHRMLSGKGVASVRFAALLYKSEAYKYDIPIDYVCFDIPNRFVIGYGLDYDGYGRTLDCVYVLKET